MKVFLLIASILLIFTYPAYCQVDTLQLVEIGSIQAPSEINELYVEDLDGDSLKEIIITTENNIHIYDGVTYTEIWTSPDLTEPDLLQFYDVNNDGTKDVSTMESNSGITLYDEQNSQTLWTSPTYSDPVCTYAIGDRNGDGFLDISVVTKFSIDSWCESNTYDTVRVHIYDGPNFVENGQIMLPLEYYHCQEPGNIYDYYSQDPYLLWIQYLPSMNGLDTLLLLYINVLSSHSANDYYTGYTSGSMLKYNSRTLSYIGEREYHKLFAYESHDLNGILTYYLFTSYHFWEFAPPPYPSYRVDNHYLTTLSSEIVLSHALYEATEDDEDIRYFIDDVTPNHFGDELFYAIRDSLFMYEIPGPILIWRNSVPAYSGPVRFLYSNISLYQNTQIVCANRLYNGTMGELSAVVPGDFDGNAAYDLDADQEDEILSIQASNLIVYVLDYATGTGDETYLPRQAFLRPNFPNPFNSSTTIEYGLPEAGRVRIDIYDLLGRMVETLVDEEMPAGRHQVVWEASGYSSGVFFYRFEAGDFVDTKRMLYLK